MSKHNRDRENLYLENFGTELSCNYFLLKTKILWILFPLLMSYLCEIGFSAVIKNEWFINIAFVSFY